MKLKFQKEEIIQPLSHIIGAVEKKQTFPVLANVLLSAKNGILQITATDTEIELQSFLKLDIQSEGEITVPARKLLDICKALPNGASISLILSEGKILLKSARSRFTLSTLPASEFPFSEPQGEGILLDVSRKDLSRIIKQTSFSMAVQDVRFYLNGMLLEVSTQFLRSVATDGHRLACSTQLIESDLAEPIRVIIPRKSIIELGRLLTSDESEERVSLNFTQNHLKVSFKEVTLSTKLIDGRFPDYNRVIPFDCDKQLILERSTLAETLSRAAILSNEKYRGIRLLFNKNVLSLSTNNPDQENASDEIEIEYAGEKIDIGFNVSYLLEAINRIETENLRFYFKDGSSSCLIMPIDSDDTKYVVMPMKL